MQVMKPVGNNKTFLARSFRISRSSLYYVSKKNKKDWFLKTRIEGVLRAHPAYGSRRIAQELSLNRKGVKRVMNRFGIRPYRRKGRKWRKKKAVSVVYPNLLITLMPSYPHHIWATDFTELLWRKRMVYVATLTIQALSSALLHHPHPVIFHSDNGSEFIAQSFVAILTNLNIKISRSHPGCPWENGYQESFYGKFKVDLGDPSRFKTLGELVAEVYQTVWAYNHTRIHSALKMPPIVFAEKMKFKSLQILRMSV